jgi:hypothetical protein
MKKADPMDNLKHGPIVTTPTDQTMLPHDRSVHPTHNERLNVNICRTVRKFLYQRPTTHNLHQNEADTAHRKQSGSNGRISHVLHRIRWCCATQPLRHESSNRPIHRPIPFDRHGY